MSMQSEDRRHEAFDVIVVGAGPAGATAAYFLAAGMERWQGKRVALLDRERFPRDKYCGDAWCAPALDLLEEMNILQTLQHDGLIQDCTAGGFVSPSGESYANPPEENAEGVVGTRCYAIKRIICDERIARRAAEVGATLFENAACRRAELEADGFWTVHCEDGRHFRGRVLVAADGATSQVARSLGVVTTPPEGVASRRYVKAGTHNFKSGGMLLYPSYILPGYIALFRHYNDEIDLGAYVIPGGAARPEDLMAIYETKITRDPFIQRVLGPKVEFTERLRVASLRTGGVPRSTAQQFMAVGDAAGQTDPLTGEGIHTGMIGGKLAARTLHECFERNDFSAEACGVYHDRWMKAFGRDFPLSAASGRFTHRFPFVLDAANVVAQRKGAGFMAEFGAAMTGVKPKSTFIKPGMALPLTAELLRQIFLQKILHRNISMDAAYAARARELTKRPTAFPNSCLIDPRIEARDDAAAARTNAVEEQLNRIFRNARPDLSAQRVCVFYGTEYGFARELAQRICEKLAVQAIDGVPAFSALCLSLEQHALIDPQTTPLCLFLCSTAGDGIPPFAAKPFFERLDNDEVDFSNLHCAVLALGDRAYPNFCRAGRTLEERLRARGAQLLTPRVDVDKEDMDAVERWLTGVQDALRVPAFRQGRQEELSALALRERLRTLLHESASTSNETLDTASAERPFPARLLTRHLLTSIEESGDKETLHLELDVTPRDEAPRLPAFEPGDALGVLASNAPDEVQEVIEILGRSGHEVVQVPHMSRPCALRVALTDLFDIKNVSKAVLTVLQASATDDKERERLSALMDSDANTYLAPRELRDVLLDFPIATRSVSPLALSHALRPLKPRYYSIASSALTHPNRISLCVEVIRYESLGRQRTGLATTFLADRVKLGDSIPVFIQPNPAFRLPPADAVTRCVMIGTGTGAAPFRSFIQEIEARNANGRDTAKAPPHLLFFGCRSASRDFLYGNEWSAWEKKGLVRLFPAFSRDQAEKIYVQDRMKENGALLWERIKAGDHIYVCGDATQMAIDVENALLEILGSFGALSAAEAKSLLEKLRAEGRYQKDVWGV